MHSNIKTSIIMSKNQSRFLLLSILLPLFITIVSSCASRKNYVYFADDNKIESKDTLTCYTPILKPDDILGITVSSIDIDAVKPFNQSVVLYNSNGQIYGNPTSQGYLIDSQGMIEFPVIGKIKVGGLNRMAAADLIKEKLKSYIKDPIIIVRILNYKITIIGDVRNPGTYTIPNERITILDALGLAGDLNITGLRNNILVIREIDGKKIGTRIDITTSAFLNSPVYYLNQNDVVYVEQNKTKINSARSSSNTGVVLSSISLLITTISILLTFRNN